MEGKALCTLIILFIRVNLQNLWIEIYP